MRKQRRCSTAVYYPKRVIIYYLLVLQVADKKQFGVEEGHTLHTYMCYFQFAFAEVTMCPGNTPEKCPKLEAACVYSS